MAAARISRPMAVVVVVVTALLAFTTTADAYAMAAPKVHTISANTSFVASWDSPTAEATGFKLEVAGDPSFNTMIFSKDLPGSTLEYTVTAADGLGPGVTVYVRVIGTVNGTPTNPNAPAAVWVHSGMNPVNADCSGAELITMWPTYVGAKTLATASTHTPPACESVWSAGVVWFKVVAADTAVLTVSTCTSGKDTIVSVYEAPCPSPDNATCVAGNDDSVCGTGSEVSWSVLQGKIYYVAVGGYNTHSFDELDIAFVYGEPPAPPTGLSIDELTSGSALLVWNQNPYKPRVYLTEAGSGQITTRDLTPNAASFIITDLTQATTYTVWMTFLNSVGESDYSANVTFSTLAVGNDECATAFVIPELPSAYDGTLAGASVANGVEECVAVMGPQAGVWYSYTSAEPNGTLLRATTCGQGTTFDSVLMIYRGTCTETQNVLVCVNGNDDGCLDNPRGSSVTWAADEGETFHILVTSWGGTTLGNYNLALGTTEPLGAPVNFAVTTASSQFLHLSWAAPLNAGNEKLTYIIYTRPNGSTAPFEETETELTTSYVMGGLTGGMSWELQISAVNSFGSGARSPSLIATTTPTQAGDTCLNPRGVVAGMVYSGFNSGFVLESEVPKCAPYSPQDEPAEWFVVAGTGSRMHADTCNEGFFDTVIAVYEGECHSLKCVTAGDDTGGVCAQSASVEWDSEKGVLYTILVTGFMGRQGSFVLNVNATANGAPGTTCAASVQVDTWGTVITANSSQGAIFDDVAPECAAGRPQMGKPYTWVSFVGDGNTHTINTCASAVFAVPSLVYIYESNTCDAASFQCAPVTVLPPSNCAQGSSVWLSLKTEVGAVYRVMVTGDQQGTGIFQLNFDVAPPSQPTGFELVSRTPHSLTFVWGAAAAEEQVTGYLLSYQRFMNLTTFVNGDLSLSYSILGLQRYTDYLVSVAAINKAGNSLFTTLEAFRTEADLPSPPQSVFPGFADTVAIDISFKAPLDFGGALNVSYSVFYRALPNGTMASIDNMAVSEHEDALLSFVLDDLTSGTNYTLYMTAVNEAGMSSASNEVFFTTRSSTAAYGSFVGGVIGLTLLIVAIAGAAGWGAWYTVNKRLTPQYAQLDTINAGRTDYGGSGGGGGGGGGRGSGGRPSRGGYGAIE